MMPPERSEYGNQSDYYAFRTMIIVCFVGQLVRVGEILIYQSNVDLFFIDWEESHGPLKNTKASAVEAGMSRKCPVSAW